MAEQAPPSLLLRPWHRRVLIDAVKACIPFKNTARKAWRRLVPYTTNPLNDRHLLWDARNQLTKIAELGFPLTARTIVEIGTGWNPVFSLLCRMCGAAEIITIDQERLLDQRTFARAVTLLRELREKYEPAFAEVGIQLDFDVLDHIGASLDETLANCRIDYRAPADFGDLPDECADIILSRDVLEHIPPALLEHIMADSHRVLRPGGVICHKIDMTDHWEHDDKSISPINFLQYDSPLWRLTGINSQAYQNRLRRFEFVALAEAAGFVVASATGLPDDRAIKALRGMKLMKRYRDVAHDELAVLHTTLIAQKRATAEPRSISPALVSRVA